MIMNDRLGSLGKAIDAKPAMMHKVCNGFSLLEVLIAAFILTFGLLGIMGVYLCSFKNIEKSYERTLVTSQLIEKHETS